MSEIPAFVPWTRPSNIQPSEDQAKTSNQPVNLVPISKLIMNVRKHFSYNELNDFIESLNRIDTNMKKCEFTPLQLYALHINSTGIDMSGQKNSSVYRPNTHIRKNDFFGPWNFNYLLNLISIDYETNDNNKIFPDLWCTEIGLTKITVIIHNTTIDRSDENENNTTTTGSQTKKEQRTLLDFLIAICRQNQYDDKTAYVWKDALNNEHILTIEHLNNITDKNWDRLTSIPNFVRQMIQDYKQLNQFNDSSQKTLVDPYKTSKARLLADIHCVRRYIYSTIGQLEQLSYLDPIAVDLAIDEVRRTYDDDSDVLINIQNYLHTFCLKKFSEDLATQEQKRIELQTELSLLKQNYQKFSNDRDQNKNELNRLEIEVRHFENKYQEILKNEKQVLQEIEKRKMCGQKELNTNPGGNWKKYLDEAEQIQTSYNKDKKTIGDELAKKRTMSLVAREKYCIINSLCSNAEEKINDLIQYTKLNFDDVRGKLLVKFGRGLLLFGPPGTGKSEILKLASVLAGFTIITPPLSAGELNRPLVGETERLLVDIMSRANTIPYLICALIIDEIDGLVPKRDNNAHQGKVDGISVLLSHIEGVKNIPNLILLGATNRKTMMDEAFLRRMQTKVFVGRPSPRIREKMFEPLVYKDPKIFNKKCMEFLVRISTNFSGAALVALKSAILVSIDRRLTIDEDTLSHIAERVALEYNFYFGSNTLPEIWRKNKAFFDGAFPTKYSLVIPDDMGLPSGRVLIDLHERKRFLELQNRESFTMEQDLNDNEIDFVSIMPRLVHGCNSRNIDTLQIIDHSFLSKQNAFDEKTIFELLNATFDECKHYNRWMIIFHVDSLIILQKNESQFSSSTTIQNLQMYQFIKENSLMTLIEPKKSGDLGGPREQWIVLVVKNPELKSLLIDDIGFKQTKAQQVQEETEKIKQKDDEQERKCPKCLKNYIPAKVNYGSCHYHDGFVWDSQNNVRMTGTKAQELTIRAALRKKSNQINNNQDEPKLIWVCCLRMYGDRECQTGICGIPDELKDIDFGNKDPVELVQEHFLRNKEALQTLQNFTKNIV
ncbi:unnamed protein product [Adineta ricciae]|uniref:AAA+ ATPase domain-containing protein n=1 Tax=Adineta ricciae TaxID=249248 RepID=A0A815N7D7_ADIRI|nr:unnamed protein product [Adineta ricciae]CAF1622870.1 unnamed protein product [Adineta ricciae]